MHHRLQCPVQHPKTHLCVAGEVSKLGIILRANFDILCFRLNSTARVDRSPPLSGNDQWAREHWQLEWRGDSCLESLEPVEREDEEKQVTSP